MDTLQHEVPSINIRPEVSMLSVLKHLNYKAWFAVAEFIDNSIQSYLANEDALRKVDGADFKLRIHIGLDATAGRIEICDNAAGISLTDFPRAFRPAEAPPDNSGLSEFGMGMKAAACWFTDLWQVRTKALGESVERIVRFNINDIVSHKTEALLVEEVPAAPASHYTIITLEQLGPRFPSARTQKKLKDHLTSIYRMFLRRKDVELIWDADGRTLEFAEVAILDAPPSNNSHCPSVEWKKTLHLDFGAGRSISGFAALRAEGSTTHAGFAIFRRGRLIVGSDDESFRPQDIFGNTNSYRYQRLFGELQIDGFDVTHTKDGVKWNELEHEVLERLRAALEEEPLNLLRQAEQHRTRQTRASAKPAAQKATEVVTNDLKQSAGPVLSGATELECTPQVPEQGGFEPVSQRSVEILVDDKRWHITLRMMLDPEVREWLRFSNGTVSQLFDDLDEHQLTVDVSLAHPFVEQFVGPDNENTELILRFATAIAVALTKMKHSGADPRLPLHYINRLLRDSLSGNLP